MRPAFHFRYVFDSKISQSAYLSLKKEKVNKSEEVHRAIQCCWKVYLMKLDGGRLTLL